MQFFTTTIVNSSLYSQIMANPSTPKCHPCRAKGMEQINYFITPERKSKLKRYCIMKGVSMTSLLNSLAAKELELHYDRAVIEQNRKALHRRAKAYKYVSGRGFRPLTQGTDQP